MYLMVMTCIHTDILAMRLKRLGERTIELDDMDEFKIHRRDCLELIDCFQMHANNSR